MTDVIVKNVSAPAEPKITAAQIEERCPDRLQEIGKQIRERFMKAKNGYQKADDHIDTIRVLLNEAESLCDESGFKKFQEILCPELAKSRAYELLAIARNKRSIEETRARTRERVAKHRANKPAAPLSVTVTENLAEGATSVPSEDQEIDGGAALVPEQQAKTRSKSATRDRTLIDFSGWVRELVRATSNEDVKRFAETSVAVDELEQLGKFLTEIANFKKMGGLERMQALPDRGAVSNAEPSTNVR
jgi:hypothetical protein